ncbi:MAG: hypothetical protein ABIP77_09750 [Candidatus Limnocylindrales bacterium]
MSIRLDDREEMDRRLRTWLDDGPDYAPHGFHDQIMAPVPAMQRRPRWSRHLPRDASSGVRWLASAAAVLVLVTIAILAFTRPLPDVGATAEPTSDFTTNDFGVGRSGQIGRAGWYRSWQFRPQVRFRVPSGWGLGGLEPGFVGVDETADDLPITNGLGSIQITRPTSVDASGPGGAQAPVPTDVLVWLLANPDLALGPAAQVTLAGRDAVVVEGTLSGDADLDPDTAAIRLTNDVILRPRHRFRLALISVATGELLIVSIAPADRFDLFRPTSDAILASLEFVTP